MGRKIIKFFLPEGKFGVPDQIIDVFHSVLDPAHPNWWADWETEFLNGYIQDRGNIVAKVWLDKRDYDEHYWPKFEVYVGYWADAPSRLRGRWHYYYDPAEVEKDLRAALAKMEKGGWHRGRILGRRLQ